MTFRPIFLISVSILVFAYLLTKIGLVLALGMLVIVSALAGHEFNLKEALILYVALVIFTVLVFAKGFGLPFELWPKHLI
jgi:predicted cobalt transporter CbtA